MNIVNLICAPLVRAFMLLPSFMRKELMRPLMPRFVAGETIVDGLARAGELEKHGYRVTLNYLGGEHLTDKKDIERVFAVNEILLETIVDRGLNYEIALKQSSLGLFPYIDSIQRVGYLVRFIDFLLEAEANNVFIWQDAEELEYRSWIVQNVRGLKDAEHIGLCLQAYARDFEELRKELVEDGFRLAWRICRGAYLKKDKRLVIMDPNLMRHRMIQAMDMALAANLPRVQLATHNKKTGQAIREGVELGVLLGRHESRHVKEMQEEGCAVNVYAPFGRDWQPFMERRLVENPAYLLYIFKK